MRESVLLRVAAQRMDRKSVRVYGDHFRVKEPINLQAARPWHQDQPYDNISGRQKYEFEDFGGPISLSGLSRLKSTEC